MADLMSVDELAYRLEAPPVPLAVQQDDGSHVGPRQYLPVAYEMYKPPDSLYAATLRCASALPILQPVNKIRVGQHESHPGGGSQGDSAILNDIPSNAAAPPIVRVIIDDRPIASQRVSEGRGISHAHHQELEDGRATPPLSSNSDFHVFHGAVPAINVAKTDLFVTLTRSGDDTAPKDVTLNLATGQRLVLAQIQRRLTRDAYNFVTAVDKVEAADEMRDFQEELSNYCNALRDFEYMQEHAARHVKDDKRDPFLLKSSNLLQRLAMQDAGVIPDLVLPEGRLPVARDRFEPQLPGMSRTVAHRASESEQLWVRFAMASAGGLVLIVPMLIMANLETNTASLVTTSIAMFLFAAGITFGTQLKPDQVLGATAAYAAVLVVFVGTSFSA